MSINFSFSPVTVHILFLARTYTHYLTTYFCNVGVAVYIRYALYVYIDYTCLLVVVRSHICARLFVTPWTGASQTFLSFIISWSLHKFMSIEWMMPSSHLVVCHPLLLPSVFPIIRVFSNESALLVRWPKLTSRFSISPPNEYSRLISFRIDCFDILAVQGTLKSLFQHHCLKASILWHSVFFMV